MISMTHWYVSYDTEGLRVIVQTVSGPGDLHDQNQLRTRLSILTGLVCITQNDRYGEHNRLDCDGRPT